MNTTNRRSTGSSDTKHRIGSWPRNAHLGVKACCCGWMAVGLTFLMVHAADLDKDPHLAAWWTFDQTAGTVVKDASNHGHDAVAAPEGEPLRLGPGRIG